MKNFLKLIFISIENFFLRGKKKRDIMFVVHNEIMFSHLEPIYQKLKDDKRLRLWFCFPFDHRWITPDGKEKIIRTYNLHILPYKMAKYFKWDLIIFADQDPYFRKDCPKIYTGHGLRTGKVVDGDCYSYGQRSRDEQGNIKYKKMFVASYYNKEDIKKHYPEFYPHMRVVGSLFIDKLLASNAQRNQIRDHLKFDPQRKTVMIGSTWGPQSLAQNLGKDIMDAIPELLKKYNVILSLHPQNFMKKHSPEIDWGEYATKTHYKNFHMNKKGEPTIEILPAVDLLIVDHTAMALYYIIFNRPIIFWNNDDVHYVPGALFPELKKVAPTIKDFKDFEMHIEKAFDEFNGPRLTEFSSKVFSHVGEAWQRNKEEIYDILSLE